MLAFFNTYSSPIYSSRFRFSILFLVGIKELLFFLNFCILFYQTCMWIELSASKRRKTKVFFFKDRCSVSVYYFPSFVIYLFILKQQAFMKPIQNEMERERMEDTHKTLINDKKHLDRIGKIQWQKCFYIEREAQKGIKKTVRVAVALFYIDCATFFSAGCEHKRKWKFTSKLCKCTGCLYRWIFMAFTNVLFKVN